MKNKFYQVSDVENSEGMCNIVIAPTAREAKRLGSYTEATDDMECWMDLRVKAIKGGSCFWFGEDNRVTIEVGGKGFIYTDEETQNDNFWNLFIEELKKQDRYIEDKDNA